MESALSSLDLMPQLPLCLAVRRGILSSPQSEVQLINTRRGTCRSSHSVIMQRQLGFITNHSTCQEHQPPALSHRYSGFLHSVERTPPPNLQMPSPPVWSTGSQCCQQRTRLMHDARLAHAMFPHAQSELFFFSVSLAY